MTPWDDRALLEVVFLAVSLHQVSKVGLSLTEAVVHLAPGATLMPQLAQTSS